MQLKPGMKGIVIKPAVCCNSTSAIGKVVKYLGKPQPLFVMCGSCCTRDPIKEQHVLVVLNGNEYVVLEHRIKWFNDDIDLEGITEEVTKELEDVT